MVRTDRAKVYAFFHKIVCGGFAIYGWTKKDTKEWLQIRLALVESHKKCYIVESLSGMSDDRLHEFVQQAIAEVLMEGGEFPLPYEHKPKEIWTKTN